ncbi:MULTISPECIES: response regulator transcription factor [unclassified Streptomyces]|uniref:response regulator transcription factor n=1 Tax=unclassified Streptomyces TaxID=2593676 RepID=UPI0013A6FBB2|nr:MULTISPECIES: response regulator transcription factor [unclassified Streptomyces]
MEAHEIARRGIRHLLSARFTVVGEAATAADAQRLIPRMAPQVVVLDIRMPDQSGLRVCRLLSAQHSGIRFLLMSDTIDEATEATAVTSGAWGLIGKNVSGPGLVTAVEAVAEGRSLFDASAITSTAAVLRSGRLDHSGGHELSEEQRLLLLLIARGLTNKAIAEKLSVAERVVKYRCLLLYKAIGVHNRAQAAAYGSRLLVWRVRST